MTFLELLGAVFVIFVILVIGYATGYHVGYIDGIAGHPKQWNKTRKQPPSVVEDKD